MIYTKLPIPKFPENEELKVGQKWVVRLPGNDDLSDIYILEITDRTIRIGNSFKDKRYLREEVEFIEMLK